MAKTETKLVDIGTIELPKSFIDNLKNENENVTIDVIREAILFRINFYERQFEAPEAFPH